MKEREVMQTTNEETGEVKTFLETFDGDVFKSKEQIENDKAYVIEKITRSSQPNFIFAVYDMCKPYISSNKLMPQDMSRLIMLATYATYDGILMKTERTSMKKADMKSILKLNKDNYNRFFSKLIKLNILKEQEDRLILNNDYFVKGKLKKGQVATRLYREEIRYVFNSVEVKHIKKLGYFFMLIPYVHRELNIVCKNPDEKSHDLINAMTAVEFAEVIGYNVSNIRKLMSDLIKIKTVSGESIIGVFLTESFKLKNARILINPSVFYASRLSSDTYGALKTMFSKHKNGDNKYNYTN